MLLWLNYSGASCNHIVYTTGTSDSVKSQYGTIGPLTCSALPLSVFDLKTAQMNILCRLIRKLVLYKFELNIYKFELTIYKFELNHYKFELNIYKFELNKLN